MVISHAGLPCSVLVVMLLLKAAAFFGRSPLFRRISCCSAPYALSNHNPMFNYLHLGTFHHARARNWVISPGLLHSCVISSWTFHEQRSQSSHTMLSHQQHLRIFPGTALLEGSLISSSTPQSLGDLCCLPRRRINYISTAIFF